MSRPKFRIWRGDYFEAIGFTSDQHWDRFHIDSRDINPDHLNQYIGLKDKNGNEIYEGDVVKVDYHTINELGVETIVSVIEEVIFEDGAFCINPPGVIVDMDDTTEVVGNIYQNPELLEGES